MIKIHTQDYFLGFVVTGIYVEAILVTLIIRFQMLHFKV